MKKEILVLCPKVPDWGLVTKASELATYYRRKVHILTFDRELAAEAFSYGADLADVLYVEENFADDFVLALWLKEKILTKWNPEIILSPATIRFRAILPMLAGMLDAGLTADCTELEMGEDGRLLQVRPAFGNNLMAWIKSMGERQMATVRPGIYRPRKSKRPMGQIHENCLSEKIAVRQISFHPFPCGVPLSQAELILAGGAGIGSKENFALLFETARMLKAAVGASRMAVDKGFAPYACQIGQTGAAVHPRVYIAMGISGAVQHLAGMSGSERVIAVNHDPKAPIFDYADYGIVADWQEVLEELAKSV